MRHPINTHLWQPQKAVHAIAKHAALNTLVRSRPVRNACMCLMVMGGRFGFGGGCSFATVVQAARSRRSPCQGALFAMCQKRKPESQLSTVPALTLPAQSDTKAPSSNSEAGMRSASEILKRSQN